MNKKMLKKISAGSIAFALTFTIVGELRASNEPSGEGTMIKSVIDCKKNGIVQSYGNTCPTGTKKCIVSDCPPGTE